MKKIIVTVVMVVLIAVLAYVATTFGKKKDVAIDYCAVDLRAAYLTDVPMSMNEKEVATTILTQYLEALKKLDKCPTLQISEYAITFVGNVRQVKGDFMADVKFDFKPTDLAANTYDTPETNVDGKWIRNKQATLGIQRAQGTGTTTVSYGLAL